MKIAAEREAVLKAAAAQAEEAARARRAQAECESGALLEETRRKLTLERDKALDEARKSALSLGIDIARRLLAELPIDPAGEAWLHRIEHHFGTLPKAELEVLSRQLDDGGALTVVTALPLPPEAAEKWRVGLRQSLGVKSAIAFDVDPKLIAGAELHFPSAVFQFSLAGALAQIRSEIEAHEDDR